MVAVAAVVVYELGVSDAEAAVAALNDRFRRRFTRPRKREGIARLSRRGYTTGPGSSKPSRVFQLGVKEPPFSLALTM